MSIKILLDSASDVSEKEAKELGVEMLPMIIGFGDEEYYDGVDLLPEDFYNKLVTDKNHPKTSQISPYRFEEKFKEMTEDGSEVIAILISSKLSGTYGSAVQASEKFGGKVLVLDSLSASVGERMLCYHALNLIKQGKSAQEIFQELEKAKIDLKVFGLLDTLEYLKKGGRISATTAFIGGKLHIKPIVRLLDGEVKMVAKAMGGKKGCSVLNSLIAEAGSINFEMPYCVLYTGTDRAIADEYIEKSANVWKDNPVKPYVLGSTIGTHVGPGVVGVAFFTK